MKSLPIRVRVAAAFALAMAFVLAGTGIFVYARVAGHLAQALDQGLRLRAADLSALVQDRRGSLADSVRGTLLEQGEAFAQLLGPNGRVLDGTPRLAGRPLLSPTELQRALRRDLFVNRPSIPGLDEPARLLAVSASKGGQKAVLVVGATRENRAEALRNLRNELLIAGPVALLLATSAGYLLAGGALRAVESMRRRATAITGKRSGERLPVPQTGDELQRLATTLNEMLARLEATLERERSFVADAGHELRTPLSLLRAELDFALQHAKDEDELRRAVREASEETDRLIQLAADLLLLATSDRGEVNLQFEPVPAAELLESVRNRFAWRAAEVGRVISIDAPPSLAVAGDRLRLEQALGNLVENALRHGRGQIRIDARPFDGRLELHVLDEGSGLPEDFIPRAFERFAQAEPSRTGAGAGLGLAIVDAIARAHGGEAHAGRGDSKGADVWLNLPA